MSESRTSRSDGKSDLTLHVNGQDYAMRIEPRRTLLDALREECGLTGAHAGCEHGICGACTIAVDGQPVRSCLMFAVQAEGAEIRTVEGLARNGVMHPLQDAFMRHYALQCGFCTPGFLMLASTALAHQPDMDEAAVRDLLSSNICRCTGYQNIVDAVMDGAARMRADVVMDGAARRRADVVMDSAARMRAAEG